MKKIIGVFIVVLCILGGMLLTRNAIVKFSIEKTIAIVTGVRVNIGKLDIGILKPVVHIEQIQLLNPENFSDRVMIDIPEIYVDYHLPSIIGGHFYFPQIRLSIKEVAVVKNAQGALNLDALKSVKAQKEESKDEKPKEAKEAGLMPKIKIDELHLSIVRVLYKDYSKKSDPEIMVFNINLKEVYRDVDDPFVLANLIIARSLANTTVSSLINFDLKGLPSTVGGVVSGVGKTVSTAVSGVKDTGKQAADTLKGLLLSPFKKE
jgi:hypothetical protein